MTHTPAPWRAEKGSVKAISHGKWFTVALVDKKRFTNDGRKANASLIAAAPDMLEALKIISDQCERAGLMAQVARAAIAKAEGSN